MMATLKLLCIECMRAAARGRRMLTCLICNAPVCERCLGHHTAIRHGFGG